MRRNAVGITRSFSDPQVIVCSNREKLRYFLILASAFSKLRSLAQRSLDCMEQIQFVACML